jgi:hypothetical protein
VVDDEVRVAPAELIKLARGTLGAAKDLGKAQLDAQEALTVATPVFGNAVPESELYAAHRAVVEAADGVIEGLVSVLEADVDNLYRVAFRYRRLEEEAAQRLRGVIPARTP